MQPTNGRNHDNTPALNPNEITRVQQVLGNLLYYGSAIDNIMLTAIGSIATQQANGTEATVDAVTQLLNYCTTHPESSIRFIVSDMVLWVDTTPTFQAKSARIPVIALSSSHLLFGERKCI